MVLALTDTEGEYQAFANGVQIAGPATLGRSSAVVAYFPTNYRIPERALVDRHGDLVVAFRVSAWQPFGKYQGLRPVYLVHLLSAEAAPRDASDFVTKKILWFLIEGALAV